MAVQHLRKRTMAILICMQNLDLITSSTVFSRVWLFKENYRIQQSHRK